MEWVHRSALEFYGIVFGDTVEYDRRLAYVTLPEGCAITRGEPTPGAVLPFTLCDGAGNLRAYGDLATRRSWCMVLSRFEMLIRSIAWQCSFWVECTVVDRNQVVYRSIPYNYQAGYSGYDPDTVWQSMQSFNAAVQQAKAEAMTWLREHYLVDCWREYTEGDPIQYWEQAS